MLKQNENKNENTTTQNLWDTGEAILRGKLKALQAYQKTRKSSNKQFNFTLTGT